MDQQELNDENIKMVLTELLENAQGVDASDVSVSVHNGDVILNGTVRSDEERSGAESVACLVHEVQSIRNDLIVKINPGILPTDVGRQDSEHPNP